MREPSAVEPALPTDMPAIPARHQRIGEEVVYRLLVQWPFWRQFSRVWLKIEGPLPQPSDGPLICYLNHPSWWDGYAALLLHRMVFRRSFEGYLMMDIEQLRRFRFFSWLGVFSVDRGDSAEALRSVHYIGNKLAERRDRYLWIFPQGKLTPNDQRPLRLYPGIGRIVRRAGGAGLWPVALRYEFRGEQRPELFIRCGPLHAMPAQASEREVLRETQRNLTTALDRLRDEVNTEQFEGYRVLMNGTPGINRIGGALLGAVRIPWRRS